MNNILWRTLSIECFHGVKNVSIICEFTENAVYLTASTVPLTIKANPREGPETMYISANIARNTIAMVLAGGKGERLSPITIGRPKPAVPFGGKYKIIDFVLSNMFNSGIRQVYILTQYHAYSLSKHIKDSWDKWTGLGEFYDTISPEMTNISEQWYKGTADAIYQNLRFIESSGAEYVVIFGGDHIYKMDISQMMAYHRMNKADITIAALDVSVEDADAFRHPVRGRRPARHVVPGKTERSTPCPGKKYLLRVHGQLYLLHEESDRYPEKRQSAGTTTSISDSM